METVIGLLGTIIGAFLGAWATRRLSYPKPVILIDQIEISSNEGKPDETLTPNKDLINACNASPFLSTIRAKRIQERDYIISLRNALKQIEEAKNYTFRALEAVSFSLHENLPAKDYDSIEKTWLQEQENVWRPILQAFLRREYENFDDTPPVKSISDIEPTYNLGRTNECRDIRSLETEEYGIVYVMLPKSVANLIFFYDRKDPEESEGRGFAKRIAEAFACRNDSDLRGCFKRVGLRSQSYLYG